MIFEDKIVHALANGFDADCLDRSFFNSDHDWFVAEMIHFMFFHRLWTIKEIEQELLIGNNKYNKEDIILMAICAKKNCHPKMQKCFDRI